MQKDCEIYVDPEEDEVFFGSVSEKEKNVYAKLGNHSVPKEENVVKSLSSQLCKNVKFEMEDVETNLKESDQNSAEEIITLNLSNCGEENSNNEIFHSFDKNQQSNLSYSNNTCVEQEHNYSTPENQMIDKTILATPNSIVKADRDGGFLKVLSEIALVKAEVDAYKNTHKNSKEDEDKENKVIPVINIVEASPTKLNAICTPIMNDIHLKKYKVVSNSPKIEENFKSEISSPIVSFQNSKNLKNISLLCSTEIESKKEDDISNVSKNFTTFQNQSVNLIDLSEISFFQENLNADDDKQIKSEKKKLENNLKLSKPEKQKFALKNFEKEEKSIENKETHILAVNLHSGISKPSELIKQTENFVNFNDELPSETLNENESAKSMKTAQSENVDENLGNRYSSINQNNNLLKESSQDVENITENEIISELPLVPPRFSKEAKEVIEVIKKSTVDDTLNYTVQVIDLDNMENSFLSPKGGPCLNDTIQLPSKAEEVFMCEHSSHKDTLVFKSPASTENLESKPERHLKTTEKECHKITPDLFHSKMPLKYFSENKTNLNLFKNKNCAKKLQIEESGSTFSEDKSKGETKLKDKEPNLSTGTSRIPVFGLKASKIPTNEHIAFPLAIKSTPLKSTNGKSSNKKFTNIESPISAYIHTKPTALVQNIKASTKKECPAKVWNCHIPDSKCKIPEKTPKTPKNASSKLPFVQYKSAAPYEVEKRPESRLPRLAPTFQKLIGTHSPKVLKHQGRFYVKTPKKLSSTDDSTMVADSNEKVHLETEAATMRQLKGKTKETNKQKKERKKDFLENKKKVFTVVLPSLAAVFFLIVVYVYLKTKPKISVEM